MAEITVNTQSLLDSGATVALTPDSADTVGDLKTLLTTAEDLPAGIVELFFEGVRLQDAQVLSVVGIVDGSSVRSANNISVTDPKSDRRDLKLFLAAAKRQRTGTVGFRPLNEYIPPGRSSAGPGSEGHPWELP